MSRNQVRNESLLNRRDLLKLGGGAAVGAALLGACAPVSAPEEQAAAPAVVSDHPAALLPSGFSAELEWWTHTDHDTTVGNVIRAGIERFREANPRRFGRVARLPQQGDERQEPDRAARQTAAADHLQPAAFVHA